MKELIDLHQFKFTFIIAEGTCIKTELVKLADQHMSLCPLPATEPTQNIHNMFESTENQHTLLYIMLYIRMIEILSSNIV